MKINSDGRKEMNRPIRFRAWNGKEMQTVFGINFAIDNSIGQVFYDIRHKECSYEPILMQYTGLLDRNGKEIYEGDVVEWQPKNGTKERAVVNWDNERTRFVCDVYGFNEREAKERIKIIGNVYENPDLLQT